MKTRHNLSDLINVARRRQVADVSPEDRQSFARETVALWKRQPVADAAPDLWLLWKRTSFCSLATAAALVIAVAVFHPATPPAAENPFEVVLSQNEEPTLF